MMLFGIGFQIKRFSNKLFGKLPFLPVFSFWECFVDFRTSCRSLIRQDHIYGRLASSDVIVRKCYEMLNSTYIYVCKRVQLFLAMAPRSGVWILYIVI